jgi:hypothetical protein
MKFFEQLWLIWGKDSIYIHHMKRCVYCVWCSCLRVVHLSCHKGQWPPGWVCTHFMLREETEYVCCFFSCASTTRSAYVHTVFPNSVQDFVKSILNAFRFFAVALSCHTLAITAPTHWSVVSTKWQKILIYHFLNLKFSKKSGCISVEQVNILDVAAVQTQ